MHNLKHATKECQGPAAPLGCQASCAMAAPRCGAGPHMSCRLLSDGATAPCAHTATPAGGIAVGRPARRVRQIRSPSWRPACAAHRYGATLLAHLLLMAFSGPHDPCIHGAVSWRVCV